MVIQDVISKLETVSKGLVSRLEGLEDGPRPSKL